MVVEEIETRQTVVVKSLSVRTKRIVVIMILYKSGMLARLSNRVLLVVKSTSGPSINLTVLAEFSASS